MRKLLIAIVLISGCSRALPPPPAAAVPVSSVSYSDACKLVDERLEKFNAALYLQREAKKIDDNGETLKLAGEAVEYRHDQLKEAYAIKARLQPK